MTLLYITANTKPEAVSSSKTVGRRLVGALMAKFPALHLEELDLYDAHIPQLKHAYLEGRSAIISAEARSRLPEGEQAEVLQITGLCDQFRAADVCVLAAPMWSLSFPAPVKAYIDCVMQSGRTIAFKGGKPYGLLSDRKRLFIYVQSSGAHIPWLLRPALNKGLNYVHDVMKFAGISRFEELLVDGTGTSGQERREAVERATARIEGLLDSITL
jgi:Acyl carrier protein phosphodiesterase